MFLMLEYMLTSYPLFEWCLLFSLFLINQRFIGFMKSSYEREFVK